MTAAACAAEKLEKWAKEMNYCNPGAPDGCHFPPPSHFKLLCRGKNSKVWDFVTEHFHTQSHVRKVQAMLALRAQQRPLKPGMDFEQELSKHHLQQQLIEKSAAKRELSSRIGLLEEKLQTKEAALLEKEAHLRNLQEDISKEQRMIGLIRRLKMAAQLRAEQCHQLEPKLRQLLHSWDQRKEGNDIFNIIMSDNQRDAKMEKAVTNLLDKIKSFLQSHFANTKADCSLSKEVIQQEVEALVMGFPTHQLEAFLALLSREQREAMEDAQARPPSCLEFHEEAILPTCKETHQVLLEFHNQQHRKLMEAMNLRTQAETARSKVEAGKLQLQAKLKETGSSDQWELQEKYFNYRALQASWDHKLNVIKNYLLECGPLSRQLEELQMELEDCGNEMRELDNFLNQNLQLLARIFQHNQNLLNKCSSLQTEVGQMASNQQHQLELQNSASLSGSWVNSELDQVSRHTALSSLTVPLPGSLPIPVTKLSIHRHESFSDFFPLQSVMEPLEFPSFKSPDQLAVAACRLKLQLMNRLPVYRRQAAALVPAPSEEMESQRKAAEQRTATILSSCRKPLEAKLNTVDDIKKLLEEWWHPPAWKIRLPQPQVDNRTLDHWMKEFAKAKAILNQHREH